MNPGKKKSFRNQQNGQRENQDNDIILTAFVANLIQESEEIGVKRVSILYFVNSFLFEKKNIKKKEKRLKNTYTHKHPN